MTRSTQKELIDLGSDYYTEDEYNDCLKKLFYINQLLGFTQTTKKLIRNEPYTTSLIDVGCGGGLFLLNLKRSFPNLKMLGIDISAAAIAEARSNLSKEKIIPSTISFKQTNENDTINADILVTTLVCHHLTDDELISFLQYLYKSANKLVIINDLHRHKLAYWLYAIISPIIFRNRLISHDGLISIKRSFKRSDWTLLLNKAGITQYKVTWHFPFRWSVVLRK